MRAVPIPEQHKRWVVISPPGATESRLFLTRSVGDAQLSRIGDHTGGQVFLFLFTDDFWRDYRAFVDKGDMFVREPLEESYGTVAVFKDLYGNQWDLIQYRERPTGLRSIKQNL